ncbi:GFA family protein [Salinisphaera hydrothermalis]|uniref:GFA family protein n=1 Tax=Salinisphaera hydrothermalis TaxID=563188 RepID=UPI0033424B98
MTDVFEGSCFCSAVHYRIASTARQFYYCECAQCRKMTGSIAATNLRLAPAPIEWLAGAEHMRLFRATDGRDFTRCFCTVCGSGLPYLNVSGDSLVVPAGSLDTPPPLKVQRRIFTAERPGWAVFAATLPADPEFPPD